LPRPHRIFIIAFSGGNSTIQMLSIIIDLHLKYKKSLKQNQLKWKNVKN